MRTDVERLKDAIARLASDTASPDTYLDVVNLLYPTDIEKG